MNNTNTKSTSGSEGNEAREQHKGDRVLKLGLDLHYRQVTVAMQEDGGRIKGAGKMSHQAFGHWMDKKLAAGWQIESCYEAGASGYWLNRQLAALGIKNLVVASKAMGQGGKRQKTDRRDSAELVDCLDRNLRGQDKALSVVAVPSVEGEEKRALIRYHRQVMADRSRCEGRGKGLLCAQGIEVRGRWWQAKGWRELNANPSSRIPTPPCCRRPLPWAASPEPALRSARRNSLCSSSSLNTFWRQASNCSFIQSLSPGSASKKWEARCFRDEPSNPDGIYHYKPMYHGRREAFSTGTPVRAIAGVRARDIFMSLRANGWDATLVKYCSKKKDDGPVTTLGAFVARVESTFDGHRRTITDYVSEFRKVAGEISGMVTGANKYNTSKRKIWVAKNAK